MQNDSPSSHGFKRSRVLEHTLHGMTETLERSLLAEDISRRPGLFQSLDPRVKVAAVLALLVAVSLSYRLVVIAGVYGLALLLALRSAVPPGVFLKRVWLALPFFTGLVALPALFITPGPPLLALPLGLVITRTGLNTVLFLLLRVSTSVSLTLLLVLTTPWNTILGALTVLRVPDVFILMLGMTYRYMLLLLHTANDMFLSRKSRVVGRLNTAQERGLLAASSAALLGKSLHLSSEVYLAMQSRGYPGSIVPRKPLRMQKRDGLWLCAFLGVALLAVILGR
jgi:cobalt/nickel transport system permease protein